MSDCCLHWHHLTRTFQSRKTYLVTTLAKFEDFFICLLPLLHVIWWRFGLVGNVVGRINEVNQHRARLVLGWVTVLKTGKPSLYVTSHPGQLSLDIAPRVGKMSTADDYGHRQGRNGEFCVTVGPVTRTADILTQSFIWRTSLIGFNPRRLKVLKRG